MEDKNTPTILLYILGVALLVLALYIAEKKQPSEASTITDTYYENGRKFSIATRSEGGCNYVVVRSTDGVAITPALNQPETCRR